MNKEEILDLERNGFEHEGLYVFLKGAEADPDLQRSLIEKVTRALLDARSQEMGAAATVREVVEANIQDIPEGGVAAMKLGQYSRQGFNFWRQKYAEKAAEAANRPNPSFLIGHSTFTGIVAFIEEHARVQKPLQVLLPSLIANAERGMCGYRIQEGSVEFLPKDFDRDPDSIVIDDVRNTGGTERAITTFWTLEGKFAPPAFEFLSVA